MKKLILLVLGSIILMFLTSCNSSINSLNDGYKYLKNGDLNTAENYFIIVLKSSNDSSELSEASEGLGWINLLKDLYSIAKIYFNQSIFYNPQNVDAYLGLTITNWEMTNWNNMISAAQHFKQLAETSYKFQKLPQVEISWSDCMKLLAMGYFLENHLDELSQLINQLPSDDFTKTLQEVIN